MGEGPANGQDRILIYDAECRLCVTAKQGLERVGGEQEARFVPYQSAEAVCRLRSEYKPGRPHVAYLVEPDGTIKAGLDAFLPLLPGLPGGWLLLAFAKVPLLRPLAHWAYKVVARNRYRWFGSVKG